LLPTCTMSFGLVSCGKVEPGSATGGGGHSKVKYCYWQSVLDHLRSPWDERPGTETSRCSVGTSLLLWKFEPITKSSSVERGTPRAVEVPLCCL
jgi:hypothetical protein